MQKIKCLKIQLQAKIEKYKSEVKNMDEYNVYKRMVNELWELADVEVKKTIDELRIKYIDKRLQIKDSIDDQMRIFEEEYVADMKALFKDHFNK